MNPSQNTPENPQISHRRQHQPDNDPDQTQKRAPKFSIESLRNNLQEISQETREITQGILLSFKFSTKIIELPAEVDVQALAQKVAELDKKQRVWLFFYHIWLYINARNILMVFSPGQLESAIMETRPKFAAKEDFDMNRMFYFSIAMVLATSVPCIFLIIATHKKSLKLTNIGLKVTIVGMLVELGFIIRGWYKTFVKFQELSMNNESQFSLDEEIKERLKLMVMQTGMFLLFCFLTYGGGRKFQNYLIQRERLLKNKME